MEMFAKFYSQRLFFPGQNQKILSLKISQSLELIERIAKRHIKKDLEIDFTTKTLTQLNDPKQGSFAAPKVNEPKEASL